METSLSSGDRDFAAISFSFLLGSAAGAIASGRFSISTTQWFAVPSMAAILAFLLTSINERPDIFRLMSVFLFSGLFCSLSGFITSGDLSGENSFPSAVTAVCTLRDIIDRIPWPSENSGPLVKALLTGDRTSLSKELTGAFRDSGASHLLALSGLHLGMIYLVLSKACSMLGKSRIAVIVRYMIIVTASGFYAVMTGASPSITRAFLYISLRETAGILGREKRPLRILSAAFIIQVAIKPDVITSAGFQLSYLAMAGITLLFPVMKSWWPDDGTTGGVVAKGARKLWDAASLTISCQAFTAPVAWIRFHTFPPYFLITNLIALPMASVIMVLVIITVSLFSLGLCPSPLLQLSDTAISCLIFCLDVIAGFS